MELKEMIIDAFDSIIKEYNMQSSVISENEVVLFSDKYILSFVCHFDELEMSYIDKKNGELYQYYNIASFIGNSVLQQDRIRIKEQMQKKSEIEIELALIADTLKKRWNELLLGGKEWIKEYQNFILYVPARNITQLNGEKYKGKCI